MRFRHFAFLFALASTSFVSNEARADAGAQDLERVFHWAPLGRAERYLVNVNDEVEAKALGLRPVTRTLAVLSTSASERAQRFSSLPSGSVLFSPSRRPLLDRAARLTRAARAKNDSGLDGSGTLLGIIDTGVDVSHPSLRNEDGTTRIRWLLVFGESPRGAHADLEAAYGCSGDASCAIYSASDIDELIADGVSGNEPNDVVGHGTHVLSSMAGRDADYPGIAPGADRLAVAAAGSDGSLLDADILTGARFLFDRADELGRPIAVNLSLGSGFGNHDGSSGLERGLSEFVETKGRAVVVASGNEGGVYEGPADFPAPYGSHVELSIPKGGELELPILVPGKVSEEYTGEIYLWITIGKREDVRVRFDAGRGKLSPKVSRGESIGMKSSELGDPDTYDVGLVFGVPDAEYGTNDRSIIVALSGKFHGGRVFSVKLEGEGYAAAWIEATGELSASANGIGVLFPRARVGGTVAIPASASALLAVGASVNRDSWVSYDGYEVTPDVEVGTLAFFSSAGPSALLRSKPDLIAPGEYLVAAMSSASDPRGLPNPNSQFSAFGACGDDSECLVVDDHHGVASGTSMATPLVTGTVALLFQRDPNLDQETIRSLLRGGSRADFGEYPPAWFGAGHLDVENTLLAQDRDVGGGILNASRKTSKISFAETFIRPNRSLALEAMALLRNAADGPAGPYPLDELSLEVENGTGKIERSTAGEVRLRVSANDESGGRDLFVRVRYRDSLLAEGFLPIGVDSATTYLGYEASGAGCAIAKSPSAGKGAFGALFAVGSVIAAVLSRRRWGRYLRA